MACNESQSRILYCAASMRAAPLSNSTIMASLVAAAEEFPFDDSPAELSGRSSIAPPATASNDPRVGNPFASAFSE